MPVLYFVLLLFAICLDDMGDIIAVGAGFGAKITLVENLAQPFGPYCVFGFIMTESPIGFLFHNTLPKRG
jgi:hypothetical protein